LITSSFDFKKVEEIAKMLNMKARLQTSVKLLISKWLEPVTIMSSA
jgi:hypothetical protein